MFRLSPLNTRDEHHWSIIGNGFLLRNSWLSIRVARPDAWAHTLAHPASKRTQVHQQRQNIFAPSRHLLSVWTFLLLHRFQRGSTETFPLLIGHNHYSSDPPSSRVWKSHIPNASAKTQYSAAYRNETPV